MTLARPALSLRRRLRRGGDDGSVRLVPRRGWGVRAPGHARHEGVRELRLELYVLQHEAIHSGEGHAPHATGLDLEEVERGEDLVMGRHHRCGVWARAAAAAEHHALLLNGEDAPMDGAWGGSRGRRGRREIHLDLGSHAGIEKGAHAHARAEAEIVARPDDARGGRGEVKLTDAVAYLSERPSVRYRDLGGMEAVVPLVRQLVELPLRHPVMPYI